MKGNQINILLTLLAALAFCILPDSEGFATRSDKAKSASNLKELSIAQGEGNLFQVNVAHDSKTKDPVKSSNEIFRQLFGVSGHSNEQCFTLGTKSYPHSMADNVVSPSSEFLKAGECHFTYISCSEATGPDEGAATVPVVISFLNPNTKKFDREIYDGEVVYLKTDGSVAITRLSKDGSPLAKGHKNLPLFQNGPGTIWGNRTPTLHPPLPFPTPSSRELFSSNTLTTFLKISCGLFLCLQFYRLMVAIWKRTIRRITPSELL